MAISLSSLCSGPFAPLSCTPSTPSHYKLTKNYLCHSPKQSVHGRQYFLNNRMKYGTVWKSFHSPVYVFRVGGMNHSSEPERCSQLLYVPMMIFSLLNFNLEGRKEGDFQSCFKPCSSKPGSQFSCPRCDLQSI